jgi:hypothetical protein
MTWTRTLLGLLAVGSISCAGDARPYRAAPSDAAEVGTLVLNLTGSDRQGQQFRLRNAEFDIGGYYYYPYPNSQPALITVSSETDLDSPVIATEVVPGQYYVTLSNHLWFLEKLTDQGWERVEDTVLLSPESQYAYVYENSTSTVAFTFGVDGQLIDFHHGTLEIGINVVHPGDEDGGVSNGGTGGSAGGGDQDAGI